MPSNTNGLHSYKNKDAAAAVKGKSSKVQSASALLPEYVSTRPALDFNVVDDLKHERPGTGHDTANSKSIASAWCVM
jgi:hypothetical protein